MPLTSWTFDLMYLLGRKPWDTELTPPEVMELVEDEGLPPGRMLDLGCGTGTNCLYLAHHGWEVVGVDFSAVAIRRARRKAHRARVDARFYRADVTNLPFLTSPFDLALDIGCLHSVPREGWDRYAAELVRLIRPGGLYMLYAFTVQTSHPGPGGVTPEQVCHLFAPPLRVERQKVGDDLTGRGSAWYWLRRVDATSV